MFKTIEITNKDILRQLRLSSKLPEIIEQIATCKIIEEAASKAGIEIEVEELQRASDQFRLINKLETANDTHKWLEKHQLSIDDFEKIIELGLISTKLMQNLFADQVEPYFYGHQLEYFSAIIYEIILDDNDLAMELYYAIQERETSFYDVARKYIQDPDLRRKGGYVGIVNRQDLKPDVSAAVFSAQPSQLLKPIISSQGVHLILVEDIIEAELDDGLRNKIMLDLFNEWLRNGIAQVEIVTEYNNNVNLG